MLICMKSARKLVCRCKTIIMLNVLILEVFVISFAFMVQIIRPTLMARHVRALFIGLVLWVFSALIFISYMQYLAWAGNALTKYLLPPHQSINYFLIYVWWRVWASYALSLAVSVAVFYSAKWYNRRHNNGFFHDEELYYLATGVFLVGHPLWIFYLIAVIGFASLVIGFRALMQRKKDKFSLYYFWLPTAAFVIIISKWLSVLPLYLASKF